MILGALNFGNNAVCSHSGLKKKKKKNLLLVMVLTLVLQRKENTNCHSSSMSFSAPFSACLRPRSFPLPPTSSSSSSPGQEESEWLPQLIMVRERSTSMGKTSASFSTAQHSSQQCDIPETKRCSWNTMSWTESEEIKRTVGLVHI